MVHLPVQPGSAVAAQAAGWILALALAAAWRWPRRVAAAPAWTLLVPALLAAAVVSNLALGGQLDGHLLYQGDFKTYFAGATVGVSQGWSRIYDLGLQAEASNRIGPRVDFLPYLNTPPQAWLVTPLLALPYAAAYGVWVAVMAAVAALVVWLVAGGGERLPAVAGFALGTWVLVYTLASGQNALFGALAVALCWRLLRDGREGWAGAALWLVALRPNATLVLPLALLAAGHRRAFLVAAGGLGAAALASVLSLGPEGLRQFAAAGAEVARTHPRAFDSTLGHMLGPAGFGAGLVLAALALWVARRERRGSPAVVLGAGVLASLFVTPYIHVQDFVVPLTAAALLVTELPPGPDRAPVWIGLLLIALTAAGPPGWVYGSWWVWMVLAVELGWLAALLARHRLWR